MAITVLLIGHCEIDRLGLSEILLGSDIILEGHAWTLQAATVMLNERAYDVVVADTQLPGCDPIHLLTEVRLLFPKQPLVLLSRFDNPAAIIHASSLGANGHLLKSDNRDQVITTILGAANGNPGWTREHLRRVSASAAAIPSSRENEVPLTMREGEVLEKLSHGHTNKEIAQYLGISYETVKEHVQHILRKVGVSDRTQAAVWAVRRQLV